jgi:hypothetical protein
MAILVIYYEKEEVWKFAWRSSDIFVLARDGKSIELSISETRRKEKNEKYEVESPRDDFDRGTPIRSWYGFWSI